MDVVSIARQYMYRKGPSYFSSKEKRGVADKPRKIYSYVPTTSAAHEKTNVASKSLCLAAARYGPSHGGTA